VRYGPVVNDLEALMLAVASGQAMSFLPAWLPQNRNRPTIVAIREAARRSCGEQ
jgi:DNA-binding transcriptional LysR family regulator